jgi:hypothetical protein
MSQEPKFFQKDEHKIILGDAMHALKTSIPDESLI